MSALLEHLAGVVGSAHVLTDADQRAGYERDWTGRFQGPAMAVVRPATTQEVSRVMAACHDAGVPVVPQGGNTGLVGGSVPRGGEVLLSLRRLDGIGPVDDTGPSVVVGAGVTLEVLQAHVASHGLATGVDLAARGSATIGGMVATNAGGINVVAHGPMRQQVLGLEAVLADGTVVGRVPGLSKDNSGYDLVQLLAGSEGTLAVITRVALRLVPKPGDPVVALVGVGSISEAQHVLAAARQGRIRAAELVRRAGLALVCRHTGLPAPLPGDPPFALLLELTGSDALEVLAEAIGERPSAVGLDAADRQRLWTYREAHTESINAIGVPTKLDVTLPHQALPAFVADLDQLAPQAIVFGHVADGNLHVNLVDAPAGLEGRVLELVAAHGGSIASEHGIGVAKRDYLHLTRSSSEIALLQRVKAAFDPRGLLNPGVLVPPLGAPEGRSAAVR